MLTAFLVEVHIWQTPQVNKEAKAKKVSFPRLNKQLVQKGGEAGYKYLKVFSLKMQHVFIPRTKNMPWGRKVLHTSKWDMVKDQFHNPAAIFPWQAGSRI